MYQVRHAGLSKRYQQQQQQEQQRYSGPHALAFAAAAEAVAAAPQSRPGHQLDPALRQSDATLYADPYTQAEAYPRKSATYQDPYAIREVTQGGQEDDDDYYPRKSVDPYGYGYASEGQARVDPYSHGHGHSQDFSTSNLPFKQYGAGMGYAEDEDDEARQLKDGSHQPHANLFSNQMGPDRSNQYEDGADTTRAGLLSKDNGKIEKQLERRRKGIYRQKYGILSFLLALVYIIIFIVELIQSKAATGQAFQTKPQLQPMLGPPFEFFINFPLGARFVPCMRNVPTRPTTQLLPCLNASTSATVTQDQLCPIWEVCRMQSATGPWQAWRFVTAIFIHAGVIHILFNVVAQLTLVVQVETILGTPAFALVYFAGGIGGNLLGGNFGLMSPALGASGAVYTAVGVEMTDLILNWHWEERRKTRLTISVVFAIVGLALGLLPGLDNFSHIGGFVCGILGGFAFGPSIHPSKKHRIGVWVVRLISGGLMLGFLLGLALNFYNSADPAQACRWCRYLRVISDQAAMTTPTGQQQRAFDPGFDGAAHSAPTGSAAYGDSKTNYRLSDEQEHVAKRIKGLRDAQDPLKLTPIRAHYLKKALIRLQVENEFRALSKKDALGTFGPPFRPSPLARRTDLPFLRFMFQHFVLTFPFLRSAPPNFFADKVQVFVDRFLEKNISTSDERDETTKRKQIGGRFQRYIVLLMTAAIRCKDNLEQIVKISEADSAKLSAIDRRIRAAVKGELAEMFEVNIVGVRTITTKGRLRNRYHEEFIIRTRRSGQPEVYVSRRYGDFMRLAETLRIDFPDDEIRLPPTKNRTQRNVDDHSSGPSPSLQPTDQGQGKVGWEEAEQEEVLDDESSLRPPTGKQGRSRKLSSTGRSGPTHPSQMSTVQLAREKNRLTLRAYLRSLLAVAPVADSEAFQDFLLGDPIVLNREEEEDAARRERLDVVRESEQQYFADESAKRAKELQTHLKAFKEDLIQRDGLSRVFGTLKSTSRIEDLPANYQALISWARISLASTLFHIFMGSDNSPDIFAQLKRMHGLMPYFVLRGILRVSNPVSMIRGVLDLFLAQPFGQKSLLQRMFSSGLQDDVRELTEICTAVADKVEDPDMCEKVRAFVYAAPEQQVELRQEASEEHLDLMTVILRSPDLAPQLRLDKYQINRAVRSSRAYEKYKEYRRNLGPEEEDEGPEDEDAWLYEDLHVLLRMKQRLRDKEQMISLIFEGVTADLLKDIVTIFYSPLAQVYKAANIADSLYDLQMFITDMIKTVEANEELTYSDPQRTVQVFIDLVQRHEGKFYNFVHQVHSKGSGLFDGLMHWTELFINFVRGSDSPAAAAQGGGGGKGKGIGEVDLEICLPAGGGPRRRAMVEIDALVVYAYQVKLQREAKLRRKIADREVHGAANALSQAASQQRREEDDVAFVGRVVENLGVGEMFTGDIADVEAEEDDDYDEDEAREGEEDEDDGLLTETEIATLDEAAKDELRTQRRLERKDEEAIRARMPGMQREMSLRALKENARRTSEDSAEEDRSSTKTDGSDGAAPPPPPPRWIPPVSRQNSMAASGQNEKDLPSIPNEVPQGGDGVASGTIRASKKKKKVVAPPHLSVIPEMVPLFVEMVRPALRPARTASASTTTSLNDPFAQVESESSSSGRQPGRILTNSHGSGSTAVVASPIDQHGGSGNQPPPPPPKQGGWFW
ncbi:hypothetical protein OC845_001127 [Tilletia horrida]|nr:hypothetical protein OC845_001127 [Tilletia horrida]